ncbi:MAG: hypothetical protein IMY72_01725 [Bacteroidetes bacterium]|nr:hypothetical protein [Bacteroidota bacterium]
MIKKNNIAKNVSVLAVSTILLIVFFGNILKSPNNVFFAKGGDGLKSTFGSYYHLQYDSTYWHTNCMNYPLGESVFFTGNQPVIINVLKVLQTFGIDASNNLTAILNVWLLLSMVLGAFFMYLLLKKLNLPWIYALIVANIIIFMSPQLGRLGGHFNLAYLYLIPLFLYLLKLFYDKPSYKISFLIAILSFVALFTHAYFLAFYSFWLFFLLIYYYFNEKENPASIIKLILFFTIQIILPFIIFSLLTNSYPSDRCVFPWGFFQTRAFPESVFLPIGKPYGKFLHFSYLKWEGMAYVGLVSTIVFLFIVYKYFKFKKNNILRCYKLTDNNFLNALFIGAFLALLVSFAYPFEWGLEWMLKYTGPFRQFRAIGRFSWLFYYTINIISFYLIWNYYKKNKNTLSKLILVVALLWSGYDTWLNVKDKESSINHRFVHLEDINNKLPENRWINNINIKEYQAILTFPFFHIGSEVYWIDSQGEAVKNTFIVSWKTGLPIIPVMLSRTSLSQTMNTLALYFEPLEKYSILNKYNNKNILLLKENNTKLNNNENRFVNYALMIDSNKYYSVYKLPVDSIKKLNSDYRNRLIDTANDPSLFRKDNFLVSDTNMSFIYYSHENVLPDYKHLFYLKGHAKKTNCIIETNLFDDTDTITISFWMKNLNKDLIPRSELRLKAQDKDGNWRQIFGTTIFRMVKFVSKDGWGLVEFDYKPQKNNERIRIEVLNKLVVSGEFGFDDILIKKTHTDIYYKTDSFVYKNNRYVKK